MPAEPSDPLPPVPGAVCLPHWWHLHESTATRKRRNAPDYYTVPAGRSNGFLSLMEHEPPAEGHLAYTIFGALCSLMVSYPRDRRRSQCFLDSQGSPLSLQRIATLIGFTKAELEKTIEILTPIGWVKLCPRQSLANPSPIPRQSLANPSPNGSQSLANDCLANGFVSGAVSSSQEFHLRREEEDREGKRRGGEGDAPAEPGAEPPPRHPTTDSDVRWINSLHPNWRAPTLSGGEFSSFSAILPTLRGFTELDRAKIASYLAAQRKENPRCWPNHRAQFIENLPEIHTKALDWHDQQKTNANGTRTHRSGGRTGTETGLSQLEDQNPEILSQP